MVVDDSNVCLKTTRRQLSRLGYNVVIANNSTAAMSLLRENSEKIKLILLDIIMPDVNGIEVRNVRYLTAHAQLKSFPWY